MEYPGYPEKQAAIWHRVVCHDKEALPIDQSGKIAVFEEDGRSLQEEGEVDVGE